MYEWLSKTNNRLIYFTVVLSVPSALLSAIFYHFYIKELSSDTFVTIILPMFELFLIWEPVAIMLGLVFILLGIVRLIKKKPAKYYLWIGAMTIMLMNMIWFSFAMLSSP